MRHILLASPPAALPPGVAEGAAQRALIARAGTA